MARGYAFGRAPRFEDKPEDDRCYYLRRNYTGADHSTKRAITAGVAGLVVDPAGPIVEPKLRRLHQFFGVAAGTELFVVPVSGRWHVRARGGTGGDFGLARGGAPMELQFSLQLDKGDKLVVSVGAAGNTGSGGGGTFVGLSPGGASRVSRDLISTIRTAVPLVVAGGGGGAWRVVPGDHVRISGATGRYSDQVNGLYTRKPPTDEQKGQEVFERAVPTKDARAKAPAATLRLDPREGSEQLKVRGAWTLEVYEQNRENAAAEEKEQIDKQKTQVPALRLVASDQDAMPRAGYEERWSMRRLSEGGAGGAEDGGGGDEHLHVHKLYTCPCEQPACRSLDCEACASTLSHSDLHQHLAAQELRERLTPPTTSPDALMKPFRLPRNQLRPRGTPSFSPFSGGGIHLQGDERIATLAEASLCHLTLSSSSGDSGFEMDGDTLIVKFVQDGGAAFRAGVRPGMRLVRFLHEATASRLDSHPGRLSPRVG